MAQSVIHDTTPCYQPGDTIAVTASSGIYGYVTGGTKNIHLIFSASKSLRNINTISLTRMEGNFRGIKGYVNSISDAHNWLNDGFTQIYNISSEYTFKVVLSSPKALTNVDNNTPIIFDGQYTISLS